ncbi:unnamed protein product, partial [Rotaria magnacalcarata]
NDANGVLKANTKCCCNKRISLTNNRGKFQLSNVYRHLQDFPNNNTCDKMKELIKNYTVPDHESSSDTAADRESSSNAI